MRHPRVVLAVICVGYFLVLLDVTVVNVALPSLARSLGASTAGLQWVVDGYAVPLAALLLPAGALGDLRGHKRVVLAGLTGFGVASLGCALAPSVEVLVAARAVQGVCAALLLPGTLAIVARTYPDPRERSRAIGVWGAVGSAALPTGPILGGLLVDTLGWRSVFALNVPIVVAAVLVAAWVVAGDRGEQETAVDVVGTGLAVLALAALALAVIQVGHARGGDPGSEVVVAVAGAVTLAAGTAFVWWERRVRAPMLDLGLFARPAFSTANLVAGAMNLGTLGLLFLITQYLQTVQGRGALETGVVLLPMALPLALLSTVSARAVNRWSARAVMTAGLVLGAGGTALLLTWRSDTATGHLLPGLLLWGLGLAALTPAVVIAAIAAAPADRAGVASGVNNTMRQAGGAVGIAAFGAVAGPAHRISDFLAGLHVLGVVTALLWLVAAAATTAFVRPSSA